MKDGIEITNLVQMRSYCANNRKKKKGIYCTYSDDEKGGSTEGKKREIRRDGLKGLVLHKWSSR
jgi:hypothetical protein